MPTIGFLGSGSASAGHPWATAFVQRLRELGWIEGRTVAIEYRWADGRIERVAYIAADFVRLNVAVIVTYANTAAGATKRAVADIRIVFAAAGDPVGTGLVASLARPAETSPACRSSKPISPVSVWNSCASFSPVFTRWRSWPIPGAPMPCWRWMRRRKRRAGSASPSSDLTSEEPGILRPRSTHSRAARKHSISAATRC